MMLDLDAGVIPAIAASLRLACEGPAAVALGLIVAVALVVASLPLFVGLAVAIPTLGHATWRLYRRAIARDRSGRGFGQRYDRLGLDIRADATVRNGDVHAPLGRPQEPRKLKN
jgi:hypothetical protein